MGRSRRKSVSKGTRYAVLARDLFTCRYCGARADTGAVLVVDHIIPVIEGGSNDPANLITACQPCNAGKGARTPESAAPTPTDHSRLIESRRHLEGVAQTIRDVENARAAVLQDVVNIVCEMLGRERFHRETARILARYVDELGWVTVYPWIAKAAQRFPDVRDEQTLGRYVSGCRRKHLEQEREREALQREEDAYGDPVWRDFTSH